MDLVRAKIASAVETAGGVIADMTALVKSVISEAIRKWTATIFHEIAHLVDFAKDLPCFIDSLMRIGRISPQNTALPASKRI